MGSLSTIRPLYWFVAALLGIVWYVAVLVAGLTPPPNYPFNLSEMASIALMCFVSIALAALFRRFILAADSLWKALVSALILPLAGAGLLIPITFFGRALFTRPDALFSFRAVVMLPLSGLLYLPYIVSEAYYVIVPVGIISQLVMSRVGRGHEAPVDRPLLFLAVVAVAASAAVAFDVLGR